MSLVSSDKGRILVALEQDYGVDQIDIELKQPGTPIVYQQVRQRNVINPEREPIAAPRVKSGISGSRSATVATQSSIQAEVALTSLPEGSDKPEWHPWLLAANMKPEAISGGGTRYRPSGYAQGSLTVYEYMDNLEDNQARLRRSEGVRGTFTLQASLREELYLTWEGLGTYNRPGQSEDFYDQSGSLQKDKDGQPIPSRDVEITVMDPEEGHEYVVFVDGAPYSYVAQSGDDEGNIAQALASLIDSSPSDVVATSTGPAILIEGDSPSARFNVRIPRREDKLSISSNERWADEEPITASHMVATLGGLDVALSGFSLTTNMSPEGIETITGDSGISRVIATRDGATRVQVTMELLDATEDVYNMVMDRWEDDGFLTFDLVGGNSDTEFRLRIDRLQIPQIEPNETGNFMGWTVTGELVGQWEEIGGGDDFILEIVPK